MQTYVVKFGNSLPFDMLFYGSTHPTGIEIHDALRRRGVDETLVAVLLWKVVIEKSFDFGQGRRPRPKGWYEADQEEKRKARELARLYAESRTAEQNAKSRYDEKQRAKRAAEDAVAAARVAAAAVQGGGDEVRVESSIAGGGLTCAEYAQIASGGAGSGHPDYMRYYMRARRGLVTGIRPDEIKGYEK